MISRQTKTITFFWFACLFLAIAWATTDQAFDKASQVVYKTNGSDTNCVLLEGFVCTLKLKISFARQLAQPIDNADSQTAQKQRCRCGKQQQRKVTFPLICM